jgi:hypothetical protein
MPSPKQVKVLLDKLCIDLGFCLPPAEQVQLCNDPPETALAFTDAVFRAEGLNPEHADRHLYRQVRDYVVEGFRRGDDEHDA